MAGGRGERMRPMTDTTPKPLLPLGNSTVIDRNVNALRRCGVKNITVTTRYLAEQIENHFNGTEVNCVREETPLGTLVALALVQVFDMGGHTLLMNSDLFTNIDFEALYLQHVSEGNDITIATVSHAVSIPFAVLSTYGPRVVGIDEKPVYTHYANAGIYLISNRLLKDLEPERIDAPDFIANHIEQGAKVGHFPITGTWLDIGTPADYRQAQELLRLLPH
jgi:NDP-sugar pyrophosphorylase family protein